VEEKVIPFERRTRRILVVGWLAIVFAFGCGCSRSAKTSARPADELLAQQELPMSITLRIDKSRAVPAEPLVIDELVPDNANFEIASVDHEVLRIGQYDSRIEYMVNFDHQRFLLVNPDSVFDGLPWSMGYAHGAYNYWFSGQKGVRFRFKPNTVGVFLIKSKWLVRDPQKSIESNPLVLIVAPPIGSDGRAVLKPEWFAWDGWLDNPCDASKKE
jgi:hypothetical protein